MIVDFKIVKDLFIIILYTITYRLQTGFSCTLDQRSRFTRNCRIQSMHQYFYITNLFVKFNYQSIVFYMSDKNLFTTVLYYRNILQFIKTAFTLLMQVVII